MNENVLETTWFVLFVVYAVCAMLYFNKKHPESFGLGSTPELKQKFQKQLLLSYALIFVWIAGFVAIPALFTIPTTLTWLVLGLALFGTLIPLSGMLKKA